MRLIDTLSKKELNELIGRCWMTHDGMWFYHCLQEFGIETTNRINQAAMRALAPFEINRFKTAMGIQKERLESFDEFVQFFSNSIDLLIPDFMNVAWTFAVENTVQWEFNQNKCFAYKGINRLGVLDRYECGPLYRIRCWFDCLGIQYTMQPNINLCVMNERDNCEGKFHLSF